MRIIDCLSLKKYTKYSFCCQHAGGHPRLDGAKGESQHDTSRAACRQTRD